MRVRVRVDPETKTLALAICSLLMDYWESRRQPWWFEDFYTWVSRWEEKQSV